MDHRHCAQDVLRCRLCKTPAPPMYCDICHIHLCKGCVGEHLSNQPLQHTVVPFNERGSTIICPKHSPKLCELYCEQCDNPICVLCASSEEHQCHKFVDLTNALERHKQIVQQDLHELENVIYPKYQEIASSFPIKMADLNDNSKKLTEAFDKHGKQLHMEIDTIIANLKFDLEEMDLKYITFLNEQEDEITRKVSEITQTIADLKKLLNTNDFSQVSVYKSMNAEFRQLPPQISVSLPRFTPQTINREQIYQQFGFMSELVFKTEKPDRLLIDEPKVISVTETEFGESKNLHSVSCLNQEEVWACGQDNMIRLYNLKGELVKAIHTKTGNNPENITVTRNGDLLYTDADKRSVNIVKHLHIQKIIKCWGWRPFGVTSTSSGDLLVAMDSDDYKHTRIVRYSGSILLNCIEIADNGQPLFSSGRYIRYINENKNHDICVSDWYAGAVVVVNPTGKLRFTYTGPPSKTKGSLYPYGITTDSQSRILIADDKNNCIHIINQDGWFLRFIDNCDLHSPWGLCVDTNDNLFVAEKEGQIKKIQYYM
ncbi:tripartite motif-containing protein 2 [Magallana gigas]|uniref:tripartite motif-containing protein 2 n=1 Tax=Magallana gigas TaxID=29159 RepID=UPI00333F96C7